MPEQLWITALLNRYFGGVANSVLNAVGIHPAYPAAPMNNTFAMELVVFLLLIIFFVAVRSRLKVEQPGGLQNVVEMLNEYISEQAHDIIGHEYESYVPYVITLGLFILLSNLIGLVPGFDSPTADPVVPLGLAATTFIYYHFHGLRHHGAHYIKQFLGPVWWLAPLMFLIEVISHFARIMSLTIRLYANMYAGELVTLAFFSLIPILVPVVFIALHKGVALVQTFIFVMLTMVYLGMALSEEH